MSTNREGEAGVTQARRDPNATASRNRSFVPSLVDRVVRAVQTPTTPATDATEVKLSGEWPDGGEIYWGRNAPQHGGGHYLGVSGTEVASVTIPDEDRMRVATVLEALAKSLRGGNADEPADAEPKKLTEEPPRFRTPYRAIMCFNPASPNRGYVHYAGMGAAPMAWNGERKWFAGETTDEAAHRLDREGWGFFAVDVTFVGTVNGSTALIATNGNGGDAE